MVERKLVSFVAVVALWTLKNSTNKVNSPTRQVEIHTRQKLLIPFSLV